PKAIEHPAQLDANAPTAFILRFFAELLRAAPLSNGKQQFDRIALNDQEKAWIGQKPLVPILMRDQQPLQSRAIRQTSKQSIIVSFQPARKGAKVASFQGEQQADRDQLTRIQLGLTVLGNLLHLVVD